jgi:hypothetical protein
MSSLLDNPEHWRSRAQKARLLADQLTDLLAKAATLRLADEYDQLVRAADRILADDPNAR